MKAVYSGSPDKTEVSGSSPEWPTKSAVSYEAKRLPGKDTKEKMHGTRRRN